METNWKSFFIMRGKTFRQEENTLLIPCWVYRFDDYKTTCAYMKTNGTEGLNVTLWYSTYGRIKSWKISMKICIEKSKNIKDSFLSTLGFLVNPIYKGYRASGISIQKYRSLPMRTPQLVSEPGGSRSRIYKVFLCRSYEDIEVLLLVYFITASYHGFVNTAANGIDVWFLVKRRISRHQHVLIDKETAVEILVLLDLKGRIGTAGYE
ncbi:hypothetical protein Tco_0243409, partial [Tanacetum coccineum]